MIGKLRIRIARWILGKHCLCYKMGYHAMVDFKQRTVDELAKTQENNKIK